MGTQRRHSNVGRTALKEQFRAIGHGFSTRIGGTSRLEGKPALNLGFTEWDRGSPSRKIANNLSAALNPSDMTLVGLRQVHSDVIYRVDSVPAEPSRGDALITQTPGLLLTIQTADCVPVLLADNTASRGGGHPCVAGAARGPHRRKSVGSMRWNSAQS